MHDGDIAYALRLMEYEQWGYSREELERVLQLSLDGSFVWDDGELRGLITSVRYSKTAVIGHLLVVEELRGRGIGSALLDHVLSVLDSKGIDSVIVFSTEDGVDMYRRAGFSLGPKMVSYGVRISGEVAACPGAEAVSPCDLDEIIDIDERIFGDSRRKLIELLYSQYPQLCFKTTFSGSINGYLFARKTPLGGDLGPWVSDPSNARILLSAALESFTHSRLDLGYFEDNGMVRQILRDYPPVKEIKVMLMARGAVRYGTDLARVFSIAGFELG